MEKGRLIEWGLWQLWPLLVAQVNSPKLQDWRKRNFWPKLLKIEECQSLITVVPQLSFPKISPLKTLKVRDSFDLESEVFWHSSWYFSSSIQPRSLWSWFKQSCFSKTEDHFYQKSNVILLPVIDLQPTNLTWRPTQHCSLSKVKQTNWILQDRLPLLTNLFGTRHQELWLKNAR